VLDVAAERGGIRRREAGDGLAAERGLPEDGAEDAEQHEDRHHSFASRPVQVQRIMRWQGHLPVD
jgi:hypothetical protein